MSEHTPGPWQSMRVNAEHNGGLRRAVVDKNNRDLLHRDEPQAAANARLIAAAPDLLEALQRLTHPASGHECYCDDLDGDDCAYCQGREAVRKATGGEVHS